MRNMIVWEAIAVYKEVDGKVNCSARLSPPQAEIFGVLEYIIVGFMLMLYHFRCSNVLYSIAKSYQWSSDSLTPPLVSRP